MTTIAIDGTSIAADSRVLINGRIVSWDYRKIIITQGHVFAMAGDVGRLNQLIEWYLSGHIESKAPGGVWTFVIIDDKRRIFEITNTERHPRRVVAPYAWGSGEEFAIGAMYAGATAQEAVRIAAKWDSGTGGTVRVLDIDATLLKAKAHKLNTRKTKLTKSVKVGEKLVKVGEKLVKTNKARQGGESGSKRCQI